MGTDRPILPSTEDWKYSKKLLKLGCQPVGFLVKKLREVGFTLSRIDDYVFYCYDVIFIFYFNDGFFLCPSKGKTTAVIVKLQNLDLDIKVQGYLANYVSVAIKQLCDGTFGLTQGALFNTLISEAELNDKKVKPIPASVKEYLHTHKDKPPNALELNYCSAMGELNHVGQTSHPEFVLGVHQLGK